ncbi:hypothetical protein BH09VER1_BH09VER1_05320 [soil metagenome]
MKCALSIILTCLAVLENSHGETLTIDFTKKDVGSKVEWSTGLDVTAEGLGWGSAGKADRDGWFLTRPVGLGSSWAPTTGANITATIQPPATVDKQGGEGATYRNWPGQLYVRYSVDAKNWTTWQSLNVESKATRAGKGVVFSQFIGVPLVSQREYADLRGKYIRMDVPWKSDEEATVKWILTNDPKFFERVVPFVGWVQFLLEGRFVEGRRLTSFTAEMYYDVDMIVMDPKDPALKKGRDVPWRFKAEVER